MEEVRKLEMKVQSLRKRIQQRRQDQPKTEVIEYEFTGIPGQRTLTSLFGDKDTLIFIHNMGATCPYCTLWADGFNGFLPEIESNTAFVVGSPDAPEKQRTMAEKRKWRFTMVSTQGTTFLKDMGFVTPTGEPIPGVSVFVKENGKLYRTTSTVFGPGDDYCSIWNLFALLPGRLGDWKPNYRL